MDQGFWGLRRGGEPGLGSPQGLGRAGRGSTCCWKYVRLDLHQGLRLLPRGGLGEK